MKTIVTVFLVLASSFFALAGGERLIGTWKSNKQMTLVYLKAHTQLTAEQLDKVGQVLGKMTMTFDKTDLTVASGHWTFRSPYKVTGETGNVIVIQSKDPDSHQMTESKLEFDGNGFWSPDERVPGYKERFDKVGRTEGSKASN